jgi:hypothetical protein
MKTNYFLNLSDSLKMHFYGVKNTFKNDTQKGRDFYELSVCLQIGKIEKFEEFFLERYNPFSFMSLIAPAIANGKIETFIKLEEKAIKLKKDKSFYENTLELVMNMNNLNVLKYLVDKNIIDKQQITYKHIIEAHSTDSTDVLNYLLYDLKVPTNDDLINNLKLDPIGRTHIAIIDLIEKRDLLFQLDKDLTQTETGNKPKPNKL